MTTDVTTLEAPHLEADTLAAIAQETFSSLLLPPDDELVPVPAAATSGEVSSSVSVTGGWEGSIVVSLSMPAAKRLTCAMVGLEPHDEPSEVDLVDAVGELVNMIGGMVKSILPGPSALSLPQVLMGSGETFHPGARQLCRVDFAWQGESFSSVVWSREEAQAA